MRTDKAAQLEELRKLEKMCENGHGYASKIKRKRRRKRGRGRKDGGSGGKKAENAFEDAGFSPSVTLRVPAPSKRELGRSERGSELFPALTEGGKELWNHWSVEMRLRVRDNPSVSLWLTAPLAQGSL